MEDAVSTLVKNFSMSVCEDTDKTNVTEKVHNLLLSGIFLGKEVVLVRCMIGFNAEYGCVLKLFVRSCDETASNFMLKCIN
jgi:coatomer protein complex subunit gamma